MAYFTDEQKEQIKTLYGALLHRAADVLQNDDARLVRELLHRAASEGKLPDDQFGINPVVAALETAHIMAEEIGVSRAALLGVIIQPCMFGGVTTEEEVRVKFGDDVAGIISGLRRLHELYLKSPSVQSENFRTLLISFAQDMRVILIMIANRVYTMRSIRDAEDKEAQRRVAQEAAYLYAPLAHKLGLYRLKSELEDLSLKYLEHDAYYLIKEKLNETKASRDAYIAAFIGPLDEKLKALGLKYHIKGRTKSIHSIYQKMKKQHVGVEGIYDLFAIRVILDSPLELEKQQCWQVYSVLADMYQPNPKRMRDWLSVPKTNGYESLHITVLGPQQKWVEVQIRTERMDEVAERGLAAHWRYKGVKAEAPHPAPPRGRENTQEATVSPLGGTKGEAVGIDEWLDQIRTVLESGDDMQLMDQFRRDLSEDEVFAFTPKGDLFKLPAGATVLDFAYAIHTGVGNRCTGARIDGKNVPLRTPLTSGATVEILTSNNQVPKQDWINFVTTSKARNKIRQTLKEMDARQAAVAREEVERKMKNRKIEYDEPAMMRAMKKMGFNIVTDFYKSVAEGKTDIQDFIEVYQATLAHERGEAPVAPVQSTEGYVDKTAPSSPLGGTGGGASDILTIDHNLKGIDFQLARCCQPVYGDPVFGFLTNGGGIKIHRETCPNAPQLRERFGYRIVRAQWAGKRGSSYPITLRVVGTDDMGIVNNITSIISKEEKIALRSISIDSHDGLFDGTLTVMLEDTTRLTQLLKKLQTVRGVKQVARC